MWRAAAAVVAGGGGGGDAGSLHTLSAVVEFGHSPRR